MKAAQINSYGGPEVIQINEITQPEPKEGQIQVEVHAASINPIDWKLRAGYLKEMAPLEFPITLGGDYSGVVSKVGPGLANFKPGDEVFGSAIVLGGGSGSMAEFAAGNAANAVLKPEKTSHAQAASLVLVGVSALQAIDDHMKLKSGQKILIHGGAGGIGSIAVEYAKHLGAHVTTTARSADADFVKELGADEVIDYEKQKFEDLVKNYDAVFDTVGGDVYNKSFKVLKKGGILVSMTEQPNDELAKQYGVTAIAQQSSTDSASLEKLAKLVDEGVIKAQVDKEFPLEQTAEAFKHLETGHVRGKVIINVQ